MIQLNNIKTVHFINSRAMYKVIIKVIILANIILIDTFKYLKVLYSNIYKSDKCQIFDQKFDLLNST